MMWRSFMSVPNEISSSQAPKTFAFGRSQVPVKVVDTIFDKLNILDRCCLALCSKALLRHAVYNEHLDYLLDCPPSRRELLDFFARRLGQGWIGDQLRYCPSCGNFASTHTADWRLVSERLTRERSGSVADLWRSRRDDGWLRYWIERWCSDTHRDSSDSAASTIRKQDKTKLLCPKCAILDPESNTWRKQFNGTKSGG